MDDRLTAALCALRLSRLGNALAAAGLGELAACEHALLESRTAFLSTLRSAGIGTLPERQVRLPPWGGSRTPNRTSAARAGSTADCASGACTSRCSRAPTTSRRGLHPCQPATPSASTPLSLSRRAQALANGLLKRRREGGAPVWLRPGDGQLFLSPWNWHLAPGLAISAAPGACVRFRWKAPRGAHYYTTNLYFYTTTIDYHRLR